MAGVSKVVFYANSLKIGEATSAPYSITKSFLKADYTIFARQFNTNGTHTTSAPVNLYSNDVTSVSTGNLNRLGIHPNPSNNKIFISENFAENNIYEITSIDGKALQTGVLSGGSIGIETLKAGLYIIKIKTEAGERVQRFVKE